MYIKIQFPVIASITTLIDNYVFNISVIFVFVIELN